MSTEIVRHIALILFLVIECASPKEAINIALKKNITQSGTYLDFEIGNGADNAADGDTNPDSAQHHCSHTKANKNAWLTVDFGSPLLVASLKIYNRLHDPAYKRLQNFYILVGDSTNRLQQQLCHHYKGIVPRGNGDASASDRPHAYIICSATLLGRYVTIQKANDEDTDGDPGTYDGHLSICEVEIFQNRSNDCATNPCSNGATCVEAAHGYTCTCMQGTTGISCETDIDECASNPCQNGATCADRLRGYTCHCATGYTSIHCDKDIDECGSNPCQNGATCTDLPQGYSCACVAGQYTGTRCETVLGTDDCTKTPCQNGATCRRGPSGSTCICETGFTGRHCQTVIDTISCNTNHCTNGATCIKGTCYCAHGFTGKECQTDIDECVSSPCRNGGRCEDKFFGYVCKCPALFSGPHCDSVLLVAVTAAAGLLALFAVVILVICVGYRRRKKNNESKEPKYNAERRYVDDSFNLYSNTDPNYSSMGGGRVANSTDADAGPVTDTNTNRLSGKNGKVTDLYAKVNKNKSKRSLHNSNIVTDDINNLYSVPDKSKKKNSRKEKDDNANATDEEKLQSLRSQIDALQVEYALIKKDSKKLQNDSESYKGAYDQNSVQYAVVKKSKKGNQDASEYNYTRSVDKVYRDPRLQSNAQHIYANEINREPTENIYSELKPVDHSSAVYDETDVAPHHTYA